MDKKQRRYEAIRRAQTEAREEIDPVKAQAIMEAVLKPVKADITPEAVSIAPMPEPKPAKARAKRKAKAVEPFELPALAPVPRAASKASAKRKGKTK